MLHGWEGERDSSTLEGSTEGRKVGSSEECVSLNERGEGVVWMGGRKG